MEINMDKDDKAKHTSSGDTDCVLFILIMITFTKSGDTTTTLEIEILRTINIGQCKIHEAKPPIITSGKTVTVFRLDNENNIAPIITVNIWRHIVRG